MTDGADIEHQALKKSLKTPLIIGVVLALIGGGAGFFAVQKGVFGKGESSEDYAAPTASETPVFLPLQTIVVSLPKGAAFRHLRFAAQLEVNPHRLSDVEAASPRIINVLNSYLRALAPDDFQQPAILPELRSQMLRRVQVVTEEGWVKDLLVMEFVLN